MTTKNATMIGLALALLTLAYSALVFGSLPDRVPMHWNIRGEVDGWASREWGTFGLPGAMIFCVGLLYALPWLSPRNFHVDPFRTTFNYVVLLVIVTLGLVHLLALQAALNPAMDSDRFIIVGVCLLVMLLGNVMGKVKRNFWVGIRTPWTLANETVWAGTHRLGGRLMVAAGLLVAVCAALGLAPAVCFVVLISSLVAPAGYSLVLYKQLERGARL
jgi:uncharacterized membrane protein